MLVKTISLGFAGEGFMVNFRSALLANGPNSYLSGVQEEYSSADPKIAITIFKLFFILFDFK
jgi:hypothetical protein